MISHKSRPYIFGLRIVVMVLLLKISRKCRIHGWKYFFGDWRIFRIDNGEIELHSGTWIETNVLLHAVAGSVHIGSRTFINRGTIITCRDSITIGNDVLIGDHVSIWDHDHNISADPTDAPYGQRGYASSKVEIGNNVWIGSHAVILKGVRVGEDSVIGAGSVVCHNVPAGEVWGGIPAKKLK